MGIFGTRPRFEVSRYNSLVPCEDGHLLHSQMKGTLILLNDERTAQYRRMERGDFTGVPKTFLKTLEDGGYFKKKGTDERTKIADFWEQNVSSTLAKALTIVTTDRCNLGCTYCYEAKSEWRMMDDKVQDQLMEFIKIYLTSTPTKSFGVTWFGGEPTLNMQCIERLSAFIADICEENDIPWEPYIITNGTTLTEKVIDRLKACKVRGLQITVDGLKDDHDKMRPYLNTMKIEDMNEHQIKQRRQSNPNFGLLPVIQADKPEPVRSSFDDIMRNIGFCYDKGIMVSLRINVDNVNKHRVERMYELIHEKGWMEKNGQGGVVRVYTNAIFDGCAGKSCGQMTKKDHAELELGLNKWAQLQSGDAYRHVLRFTGDTCTANKKFQFVINPGGAIIKCWHHSTDDSHGIGHISNLDFAINGSAGKDKYEFNPMEDPECYDCHVLPICMGGCKANNRFVEEGYSGEHDMGCISARWTLPQEILQLYRLTKAGKVQENGGERFAPRK